MTNRTVLSVDIAKFFLMMNSRILQQMLRMCYSRSEDKISDLTVGIDN